MPISEELADIHGQTAKLAWSDLERFFAAGKLLQVTAGTDLVQVATAVSNDDTDKVSQWLEAGQLNPLDDKQALLWQQSNQQLWTVVVAPWILVQIAS